MWKNEPIYDGENRWKEYRENVTEYMKSFMQIGDSVLIMGAGSLDDISLEQLMDTVSYAFLVDVQLAVIQDTKEKICQKHPEYRRRIGLIAMDLLNMQQEDYIAYEELCKEEEDTEAWWNTILSRGIGRSFDVIKTALLDYGLEEVDWMISLGVHSQIFQNLYLNLYTYRYRLPREQREKEIQYIHHGQMAFAHHYLAQGRLIAKHLIIGLEYTTCQKEEDIAMVQSILESQGRSGLENMNLPRVYGAREMEEIILKAHSQEKLRIWDCQYIFWPFSEEKNYLMVNYVL